MTGTCWFGLLPVLHFTSHHSGDLPLAAAGNMWLSITAALCSSLGQNPPAKGTEPQHVVTQDELSFCPCRCCLLGTFSQVSLCSFPSRVFSQPTPPVHRTLPANLNWVLCAHGRGSGGQPDPCDLYRGPSIQCSAHPQLETRQAKASPASQLHSYLTYQQCSPWLNQEQGWLQEGWGLMLSLCLQCPCSWRRAAWAGSTGGRTWPRCCSAWPPPCAGCCRARLHPAARGATWSSR